MARRVQNISVSVDASQIKSAAEQAAKNEIDSRGGTALREGVPRRRKYHHRKLQTESLLAECFCDLLTVLRSENLSTEGLTKLAEIAERCGCGSPCDLCASGQMPSPIPLEISGVVVNPASLPAWLTAQEVEDCLNQIHALVVDATGCAGSLTKELTDGTNTFTIQINASRGNIFGPNPGDVSWGGLIDIDGGSQQIGFNNVAPFDNPELVTDDCFATVTADDLDDTGGPVDSSGMVVTFNP